MSERRRTSVSKTSASSTPSETDPGTVDTVSTTTTTMTDTDPVSVAHGLAAAYEENTKALREVQGRTRTISIILGVVAALIVAMIGGGFAIYRVQQSACQAGNNVRGGLLHIADTLEAAQLAPRPDGRERTPEEVAATEAFIADLRVDFALRDC